MTFIQEKVAGIPSPHVVKSKSAVATTHVNGISLEYGTLKKETEAVDSDSDN